MPISLQVKWIKTAEPRPPHQRSTHIGGKSGEIDWEHTLSLAIEYVTKNIFYYYIAIDGSLFGLEIGRTANGDKYLQLAAEGGLEPVLALPRKSETVFMNPAHPAYPQNPAVSRPASTV